MPTAIQEFVARIQEAGFVLKVEGEKLMVIHPSRPLTDEERQFIRENKSNILQAFQDSPGLDDWRRQYIEKEQSTWSPERIQALMDEIQAIEAYRQTRGPMPPSPAPAIPRSETIQLIGAARRWLGKIWPRDLEPDPHWQVHVWEAEQTGDGEGFLAVLKDWEEALFFNPCSNGM